MSDRSEIFGRVLTFTQNLREFAVCGLRMLKNRWTVRRSNFVFRCCKDHDDCYHKLSKSEVCPFKKGVYFCHIQRKKESLRNAVSRMWHHELNDLGLIVPCSGQCSLI